MPSSLDTLDVNGHWRLSEQVSLRDEAFGALAYHHVTRRLVFLKSRELVEVVRRLDEFESAHAALAALVPEERRARVAVALSSLHTSGLLDGG